MNTQGNLMTLYPFDDGYEEQLLECLANITDFPFDEDVDRPLIAELMREFPDVDILEQIRAWRWYRIDNPGILKNPRGALRRWMIKAREFGL
ncbi:MAG: hypothetical protein DRJ65_11510 [Acidobacteria bacterium]|nr:MAG: hypothetical protein DRJ65_11510 [Acidobacteriota bacterium]